jgi:DivIVA domain-containing protein
MSTILRGEHHFRQTRWRTGYDPIEVDDFVQTVENALDSAAPQLDAFDVFWQDFTTVRLKPGYHMDDVDSYLERVEQVLGQRQRHRNRYPNPEWHGDHVASSAT